MDDFAVARGDAIGDAAGDFGDRHVVAGQRRGPRDRKPDNAGADHQTCIAFPRPEPIYARCNAGMTI